MQQNRSSLKLFTTKRERALGALNGTLLHASLSASLYIEEQEKERKNNGAFPVCGRTIGDRPSRGRCPKSSQVSLRAPKALSLFVVCSFSKE